MSANIIKNNTNSLSFSEYHKILNNNNLFFKDKYQNEKLVKDKINQQLFNLSLNQIGKNFSNNFIKMLNEMINLIDKYYIEKKYNENDSFINDFFLIFIKEDRLIYSGIFFILLSFFFYFMDISS
tara:strand:+ start:367 stop:741 length:375 start_codon:yes stop_codon:yes gene_type:complete